MTATTVYPVIMSGGSGTRLWPMSREHYPKQLLSLVGNGTLLQQTIARLSGISQVADPVLVCNEEHRFLVGEQIRQIGRRTASIILEPVGRNTCPALTLAALALKAHGEDALMLVMPADHVIKDHAAFHASVAEGLPLALSDHLVTFGVVPMGPSTAYGYIRKGAGNAVAEFVEKPDQQTAQRYLESGEFLWNSGMFLMPVHTWLEELRRFAPDILIQCEEAFAKGRRDGDFYRPQADVFRGCKSDSIDYAVMEKTDRAVVVPLDAGWSDVGAWSSLWEVSEQDSSGNVVQGDVYAHDTRNALLVSQHRLVAAIGMEDVVVIETADAVLVAHRDRTQGVKEIVHRLKQEKRPEYQTHRKVYRPWGTYEGVDAGSRFQVKRLVVNPGAVLSLQMHHHRAEHWVVVKGTARVTRGEEVFILTENQSTYIPVGMNHRLANPGTIPLEIIEVQSGSYLGEDDIVRLEDVYNRGTS